MSLTELDDLETTGRFRNPEGIECKYFARSLEQAETYARLAIRAYAEGPFVIVRTQIATEHITNDMCVDVEADIQVIVVPSELLTELASLRLIGRIEAS